MLDHYFKQLNFDLKKQGIATPQLIVDAAALKQNIQHVQLRLSHAPHLKARLGLNSNKVRFHGCHAVRHDDHFHVQLK